MLTSSEKELEREMLESRKQLTIAYLIKLLLILFIANSQLGATKTAYTHGYLRYPDIHDDRVVFTSSGDLWLATTNGGVATRITTHEGEERFAKFSPDGKWIAFSANYHGNEDVYLIPSSGGEPKQLTYHPSRDQVVGWDEEGRIIFRSIRTAPFFHWRLYIVSVEGGFPEKLRYERAAVITYEPNGNGTAIVPTFRSFRPWKRYKGGWAEKIWVGDPAVPQFDLVTHSLGDEKFPMWNSNGRIYFLSDSSSRMNLWSMTPDGNKLRQETDFSDYDLRFPETDGTQIIFQHGMDLGIFNIASRRIEFLEVTLPTDLTEARTKFVDPSEYITSWQVSHDGKRLLVAARGELFTLPVKMPGLIRQWTYNSGSREKYPSFKAGGSGGIISLSDHSGEDQVVTIGKQGGDFSLLESNPQPGYKLNPKMSPDGKWVVYSDNTFKLYIVNLKSGKRSVIDAGGWDIDDYTWSPDGRYLAYSMEEDNLLFSLNVYDTKADESHKISDPRFSTHSPAWDPDGSYLYCVTNRNFNGLTDYNRGLFFFDHVGTLALFRLSGDTPSPFRARGDAPDAEDSHEDEGESSDEEMSEWKANPVIIEFNGLDDRMEAIPEISGNYRELRAISGKLYYVSSERRGRYGGIDIRDYEGPYLMLYDLVKRRSFKVADRIEDYIVSGDLETLILRQNDNWYHAKAGETEIKLDEEHKVSTDDWRLEVTPKEEWRQIMHEAWRLQRDFFYDSTLHGIDWESVLRRYEPYIERVATRDDLVDLIREIQGELHAGHAYIGSGDSPEPDKAPVGLLGAELEPDKNNGLYRIIKVFNPEPGTKNGCSPLIIADSRNLEGSYIVAVNGRPVSASENIFALFLDKAGKEVALTVSDKPSKSGTREVIVKCIGSERRLRYLDWVKNNREYVADKSDGQIAYIQLPDMSGDGLSQIGRDYFSQRTSPAMIIDDRFNGGGNIAEYLLKILDSDVWAVQQGRYGTIDVKPHGGYFGHVAVLCNLETFSDGESFAEGTKRLGIGKLIGTRTWGGWIWINGRHPLVDNAFISEPEFGGWGLDGNWMIEGHGVEPDSVVVNDPASEMRGDDKQLDAAINYLKSMLAEDPRTLPMRPSPKIVK